MAGLKLLMAGLKLLIFHTNKQNYNESIPVFLHDRGRDGLLLAYCPSRDGAGRA
jgi:hypothetical protein